MSPESIIGQTTIKYGNSNIVVDVYEGNIAILPNGKTTSIPTTEYNQIVKDYCLNKINQWLGIDKNNKQNIKPLRIVQTSKSENIIGTVNITYKGKSIVCELREGNLIKLPDDKYAAIPDYLYQRKLKEYESMKRANKGRSTAPVESRTCRTDIETKDEDNRDITTAESVITNVKLKYNGQKIELPLYIGNYVILPDGNRAKVSDKYYDKIYNDYLKRKEGVRK